MYTPTPLDCTIDTAFSLLLPIYRAAADNDPTLGRAAVIELIHAHDAVNAAEIELVGRIQTLSYLARDSMACSLQSNLSDHIILRYRSSATAMLRTAEQCRKALDAMQTRRRQAAAEQVAIRPENAQTASFGNVDGEALADQPQARPTQPPVELREPAQQEFSQGFQESSSLPSWSSRPKLENHGRSLADLPDGDLTDEPLDPRQREPIDVLARDHALFGVPCPFHSAPVI